MAKEKEKGLLSKEDLEEYTKKGANIESVQEYYRVFVEKNKDWLVDSNEFVNDDDRKEFVKTLLHKQFLLRPPVKPYSFIPIGLDPVKTSKSSKIYSAIYVVMPKRSGDLKVYRVAVNGKVPCELLSKIELWHKYEGVLLGTMQGGDFIMDDRAGSALDNPKKINATQRQIVDKLKLERVPSLSALKNFVSKKGSDGWTIRTDLRLIRGMVMHDPWINDEDPLNEGGSYRISDTSIDSDEPIVTPSGDTLPPGVTVWLSPKVIRHDDGDILDFIATVEEVIDGKTKKKTGEIQCNAINEISIHSIPNSGED